MEYIDLKLPFAEEIYDLDTFELNEEYQRVKRAKIGLEGLQDKDEAVLKKVRKCAKMLGMMELELEERRNIENMFNMNDGLEKVIKDYNPYIDKKEEGISTTFDETNNHNETITNNNEVSTNHHEITSINQIEISATNHNETTTNQNETINHSDLSNEVQE